MIVTLGRRNRIPTCFHFWPEGFSSGGEEGDQRRTSSWNSPWGGKRREDGRGERVAGDGADDDGDNLPRN